MADPTSGDPSENEANVDLKGVIKDLHDEIKALNALLQSFGAGIQANTKNFHKSTADQVMLIKLQGEMVRQNADYRKSLTTSQDAMKMFTGALTKGIPATAIFGAALTKIGGLSKELDNFKAAAAEFSDFQKEVGVKDQKSKEFANLSTEDQGKYMEKQENMEQKKKDKEGAFGGQGGMSGKMVEGISKMGEFGKKHMGGILIGAGSAGVLISILKKALSASPMFQQMMKLLNFGIMMVLRPIGDFFGFLFRPILIMLLRKFIIPWYTKMMPVMMKMGDLIGKKLAGAFEALAKGDVVGAFAILFAGVDFKEILGNAFAGIQTWIDETDWDAVWDSLVAGLLAFGTGIWDYIIKPIGEAIYEELIKVDWKAAIWDTIKLLIPIMAAADFIAGMFGIGNDKWANEWGRGVGEWFAAGLEKAKTDWSTFWTDAYDWLVGGMTELIIDWAKVRDDFLDWLNPFTSNEPQTEPNNNQTDPEPDNPWSWLTGANGMHITEPIAGVGRSGQQYLMGESGNETLIPDDQLGGGGITINIQNMSASQQDLNNLRQVILDVVQQSSSRRGRA
jgi:hypothetical protein